MPKLHRQWEVLLGYFREIPIQKELIETIEVNLAVKKNVLIMMMKEDPQDNPIFTVEEKFKALCEIFPEQTKTGSLIISVVPDIKDIKRVDF